MDATRSNPRRVQILVGLLLTLGIANLPISTWGKRYSGLGPLAGGEILWWVAVVVILLYVLFFEHRSLSTIGFRRLSILDILFAILTGIFMVVGIVVIYKIVFPLLHLRMNVDEMHTLMATPFWYRFFLVTRAAVAEETLFRGYPIEVSTS